MPAAAAELKEVRQVDQKGRCLQCLRRLDSLKGSGGTEQRGVGDRPGQFSRELKIPIGLSVLSKNSKDSKGTD